MNFRFSKPFAPTLSLVLLFLPGLTWAQESEISGDKGLKKDEKAKHDAWEELTPEQRDKLRQALRDVWADPAVVTARAEVKQASDAYQAAVKAAVSRADPSIADALAKIQGANSGSVQEHIAGRPSFGMGPKRGFEEEFKPPGFLDSLPPEAREKFRRAEAEAMKSESVKAARAELENLKHEDDALRSKRLEAFRKFRKSVMDEIVRIDSSMAGLQIHLSGGDRTGPPAMRKKESGSNEGGADQGEKKPE